MAESPELAQIDDESGFVGGNAGSYNEVLDIPRQPLLQDIRKSRPRKASAKNRSTWPILNIPNAEQNEEEKSPKLEDLPPQNEEPIEKESPSTEKKEKSAFLKAMEEALSKRKSKDLSNIEVDLKKSKSPTTEENHRNKIEEYKSKRHSSYIPENIDAENSINDEEKEIMKKDPDQVVLRRKEDILTSVKRNSLQRHSSFIPRTTPEEEIPKEEGQLPFGKRIEIRRIPISKSLDAEEKKDVNVTPWGKKVISKRPTTLELGIEMKEPQISPKEKEEEEKNLFEPQISQKENEEKNASPKLENIKEIQIEEDEYAGIEEAKKLMKKGFAERSRTIKEDSQEIPRDTNKVTIEKEQTTKKIEETQEVAKESRLKERLRRLQLERMKIEEELYEMENKFKPMKNEETNLKVEEIKNENGNANEETEIKNEKRESKKGNEEIRKPLVRIESMQERNNTEDSKLILQSKEEKIKTESQEMKKPSAKEETSPTTIKSTSSSEQIESKEEAFESVKKLSPKEEISPTTIKNIFKTTTSDQIRNLQSPKKEEASVQVQNQKITIESTKKLSPKEESSPATIKNTFKTLSSSQIVKEEEESVAKTSRKVSSPINSNNKEGFRSEPSKNEELLSKNEEIANQKEDSFEEVPKEEVSNDKVKHRTKLPSDVGQPPWANLQRKNLKRHSSYIPETKEEVAEKSSPWGPRVNARKIPAKTPTEIEEKKVEENQTPWGKKIVPKMRQSMYIQKSEENDDKDEEEEKQEEKNQIVKES